VWNRLPEEVRSKLDEIHSNINGALVRASNSITRRFGKNEITWTLDDQGNTIKASAVLRDVFPTASHPRSPAESALALEVGQSGQASDVGGHIIGHQFLGAWCS